MSNAISRRSLLASTAGLLAASTLKAEDAKPAFGFCLNTSTVRDNGKHRKIEDLSTSLRKRATGPLSPGSRRSMTM